MYEIIFRLQQSNLDSNFADKWDDTMEAAPNLDSLNALKRPRVLNTHLLPEFLPANMLQNVRVLIQCDSNFNNLRSYLSPRMYTKNISASISQHNMFCKSNLLKTCAYFFCIAHQVKIVYVIRNPKSVAVSYYHHCCDLASVEYDGTFHSFLPTYLAGLCKYSLQQHTKPRRCHRDRY